LKVIYLRREQRIGDGGGCAAVPYLHGGVADSPRRGTLQQPLD